MHSVATRDFGVRSTHLIDAAMATICAIVVTLPLVDWAPGLHWHDQQRAGQIVVFVLALGVAMALSARVKGSPPTLAATQVQHILVLIVLGGLLSAVLARQPMWAFTEVALAVASLGFAWTTARWRAWRGVIADRILLSALFFTVAGLMAQFGVSYTAALVDDAGVVNPWLLIDGFSNPRFFGQFMTLGVPLLAVPVLSTGRLHRYQWLAAGLLVVAWLAAIASGTRGTWLGLACATVLMLGLTQLGRRWAALQVAAALAGTVLYWALFVALPGLLGLRVARSAVQRLTTSLSGREIIWQQALDVTLQHPLLGVGPMHLASLPNGIAAHPHQAWLQWAAEWGLPSALLVTGLVLWSGVRLVQLLRRRGSSRRESNVLRLCLVAALVASLAQAMVDGVLVMPYSQLWLAILAGWVTGLSCFEKTQERLLVRSPAAPVWPGAFRGAAMAAAVGVLVYVAIRDVPRLEQREDAFAQSIGGHLQPRFWTQGIIASGARQRAQTER